MTDFATPPSPSAAQASASDSFPSTARVVIIGGGAVGCSILYHLALEGWTDCVLIEKNELTSGSTWHAAGNCPSFSGSWSVMLMQNYSTQLFKVLGERVDYPMNYHNTGSIRLAHDANRLNEFKHVHSMQKHMGGKPGGIGMEMMTVDDMKAVYPFMEGHDLVGGIWDPSDGDIDPAQLSQAYAKGARDLGAKIVRFCSVTGLSQRADHSWDVATEKGSIHAEIIVNAAGYRAQEIADMMGRKLPIATLEHQYLLTDAIPELSARGDQRLPLLRDPDVSYYLRQEKHGLILGPYEYHCKSRWDRRKDPMPADFSFQLWDDDLERLEPYIEDAMARVPILAEGGVSRVINGPIPYAPDGNPLIGPAPGLRNAFEACVFTFGITQSGGAGKVAAEWIIQGETEWDMWSCDPRRFTSYANTQAYATAKAIEVYSHEYAQHFPHEERPHGRPVRTSPVYAAQATKGAKFGARAGWERAVYFDPEGQFTEPQNTLAKPDFQSLIDRELEIVSERCGLMDLPGFARFEIKGQGAGAWFDAITCSAMPKPGRIGLVYCLTPKGRMLTEFTLTRFSEDHFWLLGAAGAEWHDQDWLEQHLPADGSVILTNITEAWDTLVVTGPTSRQVLSQVLDCDLSNAAFPWLSHQWVEVGHSQALAIRVTFAGELGWELHVPMVRALGAYQAVSAAGAEDFGGYALDSLRLEKGYKNWKQDLTNDFTGHECGVGRFIKVDKPGDFIGKAAVQAELAAGVKQTAVMLVMDAVLEVEAPYLSTVFDGDKAVGLVTSSAFGARVGHNIMMATLQMGATQEGQRLEVEIFGQRFGATVTSAALFDAKNERLRA